MASFRYYHGRTKTRRVPFTTVQLRGAGWQFRRYVIEPDRYAKEWAIPGNTEWVVSQAPYETLASRRYKTKVGAMKAAKTAILADHTEHLLMKERG
jgi:hypothetical protein